MPCWRGPPSATGASPAPGSLIDCSLFLQSILFLCGALLGKSRHRGLGQGPPDRPKASVHPPKVLLQCKIRVDWVHTPLYPMYGEKVTFLGFVESRWNFPKSIKTLYESGVSLGWIWYTPLYPFQVDWVHPPPVPNPPWDFHKI